MTDKPDWREAKRFTPPEFQSNFQDHYDPTTRNSPIRIQSTFKARVTAAHMRPTQ